MAKTFRDLVKEARERIARESGYVKQAFTPMGPQGAAQPAPAAPPPGGAPAAPPMDPMMMGGGAPMPPGGAPMPPGGAPMPPGGGAPMQDPAMMGGAPGGGTPVTLNMEDLVQLVTMITGAGGAGGMPPDQSMGGGMPPAPMGAPGEAAPPGAEEANEPEKPEGGKGKAEEGKLDAINSKLDMLLGAIGMGGGGAPLDAALGGAPVPMGAPTPVEAAPPGMPVDASMAPPADGGMAPPSGMTATASAGNGGQHKQAASNNQAHTRSSNFRLSRILRNLENRG